MFHAADGFWNLGQFTPRRDAYGELFRYSEARNRSSNATNGQVSLNSPQTTSAYFTAEPTRSEQPHGMPTPPATSGDPKIYREKADPLGNQYEAHMQSTTSARDRRRGSFSAAALHVPTPNPNGQRRFDVGERVQDAPLEATGSGVDKAWVCPGSD